MASYSSSDLLLAFAGEDVELNAPVNELPQTIDEMNAFIGEFTIDSIERDFKIHVDHGKIYFEPKQKIDFRMLFVGDDTYYLKLDRIRIKFSRDDYGKISGFVLTQRGQDYVAVLK